MKAIRSEWIGPAPRLSVDCAGQGDLVILLHGIGGNKRNWRDALPPLSESFLVVAWDARGWGESEDYEGPLTFDVLADDVVRVLEHFGARHAHIVGLSMGGRIAMHFARRHPDKLISLILCDTTLGVLEWTDEQREAFVRSRQEPLLNGKSVADIAGPVAKSLASPTVTPDAMAQLMDSLLRLRKDNYLKAIEMNLMAKAHDVSMIEVPTLVIVGEEDTLTPPDDAKGIAAAIPGAQLLVIPGAGHLVNIEAPEAFNSAVLDFLLANRSVQASGGAKQS